MEEAQDTGKNVIGGGEGACAGGRIWITEVGLSGFNETRTKFVPDKIVEGLRDLAKFVSGIKTLEVAFQQVQLGEKVIGEGGTRVECGISEGIGGALLLTETTSVPEFVGKISAFFHLFFVVADVGALGSNSQETEAQPVRPELGDEIERIRGVA